MFVDDLSTLVDYGHLAQIKESKPDHLWFAAYSNFKHMIRKTLSGVEYLHQRGIVHRDIKGIILCLYGVNTFKMTQCSVLILPLVILCLSALVLVKLFTLLSCQCLVRVK